MWVYRGVIYIRPGLMAEGIAHLKRQPPVPGVTVRLLRPINGPDAHQQLIMERQFEDLDAVMASYNRPSPSGEWERAWVEISQNRGHWELYEVVYELTGQGTPGPWVDRRVRYCPRGRTPEALGLWRALPPHDLPGYSLRILLPRTSSEREQPIVQEMTAASLPQLRADITAYMSTPEGREWGSKVFACEVSYPQLDLLRVVE